MNTMPMTDDAPLKHSGLGIASFAITVFFGLLLVCVLVFAGYLEATTPGGVDEESAEAIVAGLLMIFSVLMLLVAMVLGITGLFVGRRRCMFAGLGLGISVSLLLTTVLLLVIGSLAP